jgi:hypothetical protein
MVATHVTSPTFPASRTDSTHAAGTPSGSRMPTASATRNAVMTTTHASVHPTAARRPISSAATIGGTASHGITADAIPPAWYATATSTV